MESEEKLIWKNCIIRAIEYLDKNHWDKENDSRVFDLNYNGKNYPTKLVIGKAIEFIKEENPEIHIPALGGGKPIKLFLEKLEFKVIEKNEMDELILNGKKIYKFSMGVFLKETRFRKLNIPDRLSKLDLVSMHNETANNQGTLFLNLEIGDYIYITYGKDKLGALCMISSDVMELPDDLREDIKEDGYKGRRIKIIKEPNVNNTEKLKTDKRAWLPSGYTTLYKIQNLAEANKIFFNKYYNINVIDEKMSDTNKENSTTNNDNSNKSQLNQILFGPPGSGKTYNTINRALEIVGVDTNGKSREVIKGLFDKKVEENRIVFTTFHQSMSYEDFIEGIKPKVDEDENENKQVIYEVEDGIFKRLVENAKKVRIASKDVVENYSFDDAWDDLVSEVERSLEAKDPLFMSIQTANLGLKVVEISGRGNLKLKPIYSDEAKEYTVSYQRTKKLQEAFPDLSVVKNIDKEFRAVIGGSNSTAYWSVLNSLNDKINKNSKVIKQEKELAALPHVLIIDEINRGNVSAIFGELITLIEDNKRLGNPEALEVILPYSKKKFGVPSNLYIIGTMNTADRSVEALDTALRRRFSFEEMPPNYELDELEYSIFNYPASSILKTINHRIEKLLDKDHAIGHSYFIDKDESTIVESFYKCIIPLLQEYFFGDFGKIGLVLGKGFVKQKEWDRETDSFADFEEYENSSDFEDRNVFEIVDYRNESNNYSIGAVEMTFGKAIKLLMKDKIE